MTALREQIARIVDRSAFVSLTEEDRTLKTERREAAFAMADQIIAIPGGSADMLDALKRISAATANNTNSATIDQFRSWTSAVADSAIASAEMI